MKLSKISFKTAKLAQIKKFDYECKYFFNENKRITEYSLFCNFNENYGNSFAFGKIYSAPEQALLQMWLRNVHKIYIEIQDSNDIKSDSTVFIVTLRTTVHEYFHLKNKLFKTYEKALEFGLYSSLVLINNDLSSQKK